MDQLFGTVQNFSGNQGLLVSWSGFKSSVDKEAASQFFRVRFWDADGPIEELLDPYDRLPVEVRAELRCKRIGTVAPQGEES